ncbi:tripartite tricarboxylate transporter substrate binding protein [Ramlibacter sp. AW1]|uniref:Tripartite tricarboxylate transporter substrate binding protein n=1 Tax=Ramlibacter aurantiacus TaxID=2801330 RepID=A0A936ZTZ6_9BURK|nr:tripartite tricarboxylate transporter substrate-binding protein [Ramlibacter aurantiacus]MBL0423453.1 tripartite tricarboxylate transporter substrate binding protein [Ramlibacter aurantiacus]
MTPLRFPALHKIGATVALALSCAMPFVPSAAHAQSAAQAPYPNRTIKFIVPYTPGGLGDSFARAFAQGMSDRLGQPVVVENMPGASQAVGAAAAARAAPDGYTVFMGTQSGFVLNVIASGSKLNFDPLKDFEPVSMLFASPLFLVVHPTVEAKSLQELIALAKSKPGKLTAATIGEGTTTHLASIMFEKRAGVDILQVPYKGSAPAIADLLAGRIDMMFEGGASALPHVRAGKLRVLGSSGAKRSEQAVPGLPTIGETFPGYEVNAWFALFAPAGTPKGAIDRLNKEIQEVQKTPRLQEMALKLGAEIEGSTPEELGTRLRAELKSAAIVMKEVGSAAR